MRPCCNCTTQLAACGGEPSNRLHVLAGVMCEGSPATGCMRSPTGAVARQAPHARRKLPVHCESLKTCASRPVSPHSAHGARAQLGSSSTIRNYGPAPGCPSDASSAVHEPVCASFAARQPTQRARARAQFGVPTTVRSDRPAPKCPSHNVSALCEPVCAIYEARQLRSAHGGRAQFSIPTQMFDAIAWRPNARLTIPVSHSTPSVPAARPVSPGSAHGARTQIGIYPHDHCSKRSPGARMPVTRFLCTVKALKRQP